jgi:hypothetical protein
MERQMKATRTITNQQGVFLHSNGSRIKVHFDLTETQDFVDGLPDLQFAYGNLRFAEKEKLLFSLLVLSHTLVVLEGGGIRAGITLNSLDTFTVMGAIREVDSLAIERQRTSLGTY